MHSDATRQQARELCATGTSIAAVARHLGVSRAAIRDWLKSPTSRTDRCSKCFVCTSSECPTPSVYAYLLGQYLGDGYLVMSSRVPRLRVSCADSYPGISAEVDAALTAMSGNRVQAVARIGCSERGSNWMHWPCLFPQHGPGRKHERHIGLADWQQQLVNGDPWPLIRGLIHSDGCRSLNKIHVRGKTYVYPRYLFANESRDILAIMGNALDRVGVEWRYNRPNSISVARRAAVALMEEHVGPKY